MGKTRRVVALAFGRRLAKLRGETSHQAVANRLATLGVQIDPSTLWQYEHGTVAAPDPRVLWGYAQLFDADVEELTALLAGHIRAKGQRLTLSKAEAECVRAFRRLSESDRACVQGILDRLGGAPAGASFLWDRVERRSGRDRRVG